MKMLRTHVTREGARSSDAGLSSLHEATLPDRGREGTRGSWPGTTRRDLRLDAGKSALHVCGSQP